MFLTDYNRAHPVVRILRAGTSLVLSLSMSSLLTLTAEARNILNGATTTAPAASGGTTPAAGSAAAASSANALVRATQTIQAVQAAQAAARAAAQATASSVPNGLTAGGLVVAPGATPGSQLWLNAAAPVQTSGNGQTLVTIKQEAQKAILTWESYNVGKDTTVYYDQTAGGADTANWIALNRVTSATAAPSQILGKIKADGQVYIINRNGIIFGGASQVNTRGLVASTLALSDEQFVRGINNPLSAEHVWAGSAIAPVFGDHAPLQLTFAEADDWTPTEPTPGHVSVEAGAQLSVTDGGKLMLFGTQVLNAGSLNVADGQIILAAGEQVWLGEDGNGVRGLDVAVSGPLPSLLLQMNITWIMSKPNWQSSFREFDLRMRNVVFPALEARADALDYQVTNTGAIHADRGNITLQSREINQQGALTATTALNNRDGSIRLRAWGQGALFYTTNQQETYGLYTTHWSAGTVTLSEGSVALILPDSTDTSLIEATDLATRYTPGSISVHGKLIDLQSGSLLMAPSGNIDLVAVSNPFMPVGGMLPSTSPGYGSIPHDGSRIYIDTDAVVSVAGIQDVALEMSRNFIEVELRINELRDSPLQLNSWLRGQKMWVDRRESGTFEDGSMAGVLWGGAPGEWVGTPLADVSGWLGVGKTDLAELTTTGGSIRIKSGGSLITREGSVLDVSGGSLRYADGVNPTGKLLGADGVIYTMANASPDMSYVGMAGRYIDSHARWDVNDSYASPLIGGATYEAGYTEGRDAGSIQMYVSNGVAVLEGDVLGGVITGERQLEGKGVAKAGSWTFGGGSNEERSWSMGKLVISDTPEILAADFNAGTVLDSRFQGGTQMDSTTWLDTDMLGNSGLGTIRFNVGSGFTLEEGVVLTLAPKTEFSVTSSNGSGVGLIFNVNGTIRSAGGAVMLSNSQVDEGLVVLGDGARIDVSGDWINELEAASSNGVKVIDGGHIQIFANNVEIEGEAALVVSGGGRAWLEDGDRELEMGDAGSMKLVGFRGQDIAQINLEAFSGASGGHLDLTVSGAVQVGGDPDAQPQGMHLPLDLFGGRGFRSLKLEAKGDIEIADGAQLNLVPLGWDMIEADYAGIASGSRLGDVLSPTLLRSEQRLDNQPAALSLLAAGYDIRMGEGSVLRVDTGGSVTMQANDINLLGTIDAPAGAISLNATTVTLGESASLLARGAAVIYQDIQGLDTGTVLDGGEVTIRANNLNLELGALIDVSGAQGVVQVGNGGLQPDGPGSYTLASDGGSIAISGQGLVASRLVGNPGGAGAQGGSLTLQHIAPPGGESLANQVMQAFRNAFGYSSPDQIIGVDFALVLAEWGITDLPPMIIPQAVFDKLGDAARVGLSVSDSASPGSAPGEPIDFVALGMTEDAMDQFRDWFGIDFRGMLPVDSLLAARPASFAQGGFANLKLASNGSMELGDVNLSATQSITIDGVLRRAPGEAGNASITAPYLLLQSSSSAPGLSADRIGRLALNAQVVDVQGGAIDGGSSAVMGPASIRGFAETEIKASELRFTVSSYNAALELNPAVNQASLNVDGALNITVGHIYPATAVDARIVSGESIRVQSNGQTLSAPLSAGGSLTLSAPVIEQHGVLRAPFGQITLNAGERLVLGDGSITSVSGAGMHVSYGNLLNNEYWAAPFSSPEGTGMGLLPDKRITLNAPVVDLAAGSVIDIRGGGDLYAQEFVPGTGGSHDILTLPGAYAVVPGYASAVAPGASAGAGSSIWLAGGNGLAAGWYTLMPASYAALPGAWLVMPSSAAAGFNPNPGSVTVWDGSVMMAGRQGNALDGSRDEQTSYWQVMSSKQLRQYSEYNEATASEFFASEAFKLSRYRITGQEVVTPRLPGDGGSVVFNASQQLILDGELLSQATEDGRGGLVDIAGQQIAIVGAGQDASDLQAAGYLLIDADKLSGFGASSLLVGGVRSGHALGMGVEVSASDIVIRNDADTALSGSEIILAASDRIQIDNGSVVQAQGNPEQSAGDLVITAQQEAVWQVNDPGTPWDPSDDVTTLVSPAADWGALVRVSTGPAMKVIREGVDSTRGGLVSIGEGATLSGGAALLIDATRSTLLASTAKVSGAALSVASARIGLGGGSEGLVLGADTLAQLARTQELTLRSYSSIDFHDDVDFSDTGLKAVVLDAARLTGYEGNVAVNAGTLTLINSGAQADAGGATGGGTLSLTSDKLVLGSGDKAIDGFATVELHGRDRIVAEGKGSLDAGAARLLLDTPLLTGQQGASYSVNTTGVLTVSGDAGATTSGPDNSLGASLSLTGGSVNVDGRIVALGGTVALAALTGDLVLAEGSRIDVGGFSKDFYDVTAYAGAGRIQLDAAQGNITQAAGSTLNLSAHVGGGDAGTLNVKTSGAGSVNLSGNLLAHAGAGGKGGAFALDVAQLPGFGALGQQLNDAGFTASRSFRVRNGDVTVDGHTQVSDFSLTADQGRVNLMGTIDARSTYGGRIAVAGGNGVVMTGTALLQAGATDAVLGSGRVILEAAGGQLDLQGGTIDVAGGEGGRMRLRAAQTANHDEIQVTALDATILGARSAVLEGVAVYNTGVIDEVKAEAISHADTFAANTAAMKARLGRGDVDLMPGIEIRSTGDLVLENDWNLYETFGADMREGGLTLRAGGNLILKANLSDGFDAAGRSGILQDTASWDLRLVSGADLASATATSLQAKSALGQGGGSLVVGDAEHGYVIRTGTGDLDVAVGGDLELAHEQSVIYTAGRRDSTVWDDFTTTPGRLLISDNWPKIITMQSLPTAAYGVEGGNLRINTQGDMQSTLSAGAEEQFFGEWLLRLGRKEIEGESSTPTVVTENMPFQPGEQSTWFVDYAQFNQGVGALGGGNVSVRAGGDIGDLLVAMPTNGRVRGGRTEGEAKTLELRNGGALDVVADGTIRGGQYYIGRGVGQVRANDLATSLREAGAAPVLALGDATLDVTTNGQLQVATVADPLMSFVTYLNDPRIDIGAYISGYTDTSAVSLVSVGGDVLLGAEELLGGREPGNGNFNGQDIYPAKMHLTALSGSVSNELGHYATNGSDHWSYNVEWSGLLFMMPSEHTDLRVLAENDVRLGQVVMSRMAPEAMPSPLNPVRDWGERLRSWLMNTGAPGFDKPVNSNVDYNWLADDHTPSRIYARTGSIVREVPGEVYAGEQLWLRAGQDIRGLRITFRNNHADDVSLVEAGNDVNGLMATNLFQISQEAQFDIEGPGSLLITAGRDVYNVNAISFGNVKQWDANNFPDETTRINHLPDEGASISVIAGLNSQQPDYAAFQAAYLDPAQVSTMADYLVTTLPDGSRVPRYLLDAQEERADGETRTVQRGLVSYIEQLTGQTLEPLDAWAAFQMLAEPARAVFLRRVFLQELREAGRNQNEPGLNGLPLNGGYNRGYSAMASLFSGDDWKGDVVADSMTLRTMQGGDINLFAPGGKVQVASLTHAPAAGDGLVTLSGGHIGVFAHDSVAVNQSRILTFVPKVLEQGSDMIIWSTEGDVDAGRGAKTLRVPSKPIVETDFDGNTVVSERSNMSGSGIGTVGDGDVDLVAPLGTVNAGDAGLRVAGNLNIAALYVLNADNIEVGGEAVGVPVTAEVNIGALTTAANTAGAGVAGAMDATDRSGQRQGAQIMPSLITVETIGYGPVDDAPADVRTRGEQSSKETSEKSADRERAPGSGRPVVTAMVGGY